MFRATNLRLSREFYTNAVGDDGDIYKVCMVDYTIANDSPVGFITIL